MGDSSLLWGWIVGAADERGRSWMVFFGPYFHSLSRRRHWYTNTHPHTISYTVSFLVLKALGEDGMPVFPGPSRELSRILLWINWLCGLIAQIYLSKVWQNSHSLLFLPPHYFHSCSSPRNVHYLTKLRWRIAQVKRKQKSFLQIGDGCRYRAWQPTSPCDGLWSAPPYCVATD